MLREKEGSLFERRDLWVVALFAVLAVGYLRDPLLHGKSFAIDNTARYLPWDAVAAYDPSYQNNAGTDGTLTFYPRRFYSHKLLSRGEIPLWTPYILGGIPFMADPHTAVFYPLNVVYAFVGPDLALPVLAAVQLFLAGVFTYFLLREWRLCRWAAILGGVVFMFNPFFTTHLINPTNVDSGIWLPLMLLLFDLALRKNFLFYAMLLALTITTTLLGGFPQISVLAIYALGLYSLFRAAMEWRARGGRAARRAVGIMLVAVPMGAAITSVQMLAIAELSQHSARRVVRYSDFEAIFLKPEALLMFAVPDFFGEPTSNWFGYFARALDNDRAPTAFWQNSFLENNGYLGIAPIVLLILGAYLARGSPLMWYGLALAVLSMAMTMGTPLFRLAYHAFPGFTFSRICRILYLYGFGVAIVAAFGLHALLLRRREAARSPVIPLTVGVTVPVLIVTGTLLLYLNFHRGEALHDMKREGQRIEHKDGLLENRLMAYQVALRRILWNWKTWSHGVAFFIVGTAATLAVVSAYAVGWVPTALFALAAIGFTTYELYDYGANYLTFQERFFPREQPPSLAFLAADNDVYRIARYGEFREILPPNSPQVFGLYDIQGSNALLKDRYGRFVALGERKMYIGHKKVIAVQELGSLKSRIFDMLGVKYFLTADYIPIRYPVNPWDPPDDKRVELVYDGEDLKIYKNLDVLPRALIVPEATVADGPEEVKRILSDPGFDPRERIVVEAPVEDAGSGLIGDATARVVEHEDTRVKVEARLDHPGFLLLANTHYPGWQVRVDDEPGTLLQANLAFMAVPLGPGRHKVEFFYDPTYFRLGAFASLAATMVALLILGNAYARGELRGALRRSRAS